MSARVEVTPLPGSRAFIPGLDGIRGMCVLVIFLFHAQFLPHVPGELATTTFFFLSGFLITTLFVKEYRKTGTVSLKSFYARRALRTMPPLFIALLLSLCASVFLRVGHDIVGWKALSNVFSYTNYALVAGGDTVGFLPGMVLLWSLAVDEHYYLFFAPFFLLAVKRISTTAIIGTILVLCAAALAWRIWLIYSAGAVTFRHTMATDTRMDSILWGSLLALWRNPALDPDRAKALIQPWWLLASFAGLAFVDLCGNWFIIGTVGFTIQGLALIPIFALAVLQGGKGILKFLQWPWLMWVGRASYPLYLLQWIMLLVCDKYVPGHRLIGIAVAAVLTLALGAAMHYYVEIPLAVLRKRTKMRKEAEAGEASMPIASLPIPVEA